MTIDDKNILDEVIDALTILPGVGKKSALRMTYHLLQKNRPGGALLARALVQAMEKVKTCSSCRNYTFEDLCAICQDNKRDPSLLCVVENPIDVALIEQIGVYRGRYFVLLGHLSPLDGVGAYELGMPLLREKLQDNTIEELIVATNATVEGSATAHYIRELTKDLTVKITRMSHGLPAGSELEYLDSTTLACALNERKELLV